MSMCYCVTILDAAEVTCHFSLYTILICNKQLVLVTQFTELMHNNIFLHCVKSGQYQLDTAHL